MIVMQTQLTTFNFDAPRAADVRLEDVALALSNVCRFGGHLRPHYSVAQHSVFVAERCRPHGREVMREALLHDAGEAYYGDITRPVRAFFKDRLFQAIEGPVTKVIREAFGLPEKPTEFAANAVRMADDVALATERRDFLPPPTSPWKIDADGVQPDARKIVRHGPEKAERLFLALAKELGLEVAHAGPAE